MFLQNLRAKIGARLNGDSESGFTLIELLVVMLILGILAAIAIPAFFNQRDKGTDAQAKAAARTAQTAIETFATEHGGDYTGADDEALQKIEPTLKLSGEQNGITVEGPPDADSYTVTAESGTENTFSISRAGGTVEFDCEAADPENVGGCPEGGHWNE
jgi:type IV pilus assembly protein PilA